MIKNSLLVIILFNIWHLVASGVSIPKGFGIDFNDGMQRGRPFDITAKLKNPDWQITLDQYNTYILTDRQILPNPRIPKIIHQIWIGSPIPAREARLARTWKKYHPDWEYKLWTDADLEAFGLLNKALYDAASNYGEKSDIARYELIYRIGGLYVDTDFECIRPFDVLHHCCDFYTGLTFNTDNDDVTVFNGLIAAVPGHPIIKECVEAMQQGGPQGHDADAIMARTGPNYFSKCYTKVMRNYRGPAVAFPVIYFYPWPNWCRFEDKTLAQIYRWIRPSTFAIHHWHVSWVK